MFQILVQGTKSMSRDMHYQLEKSRASTEGQQAVIWNEKKISDFNWKQREISQASKRYSLMKLTMQTREYKRVESEKTFKIWMIFTESIQV